jgi:hypothetical protein
MKGRALVLASALVLGGLAAGAAPSCTSTTTVVTPSGVCEDITHSTPTLFSPAEGACVQPAADGTVPVIVDVNGTFAFRPPGVSCAYVCNCGYLQVYVDGVLNNTSGTAVIDANLAGLGSAMYGTHTFTVQLVWDINDGGGEDLFDAGLVADAGPDGGPNGLLTASVTVNVAPSCFTDAGTSDAGDAGTSDAGDAGSSDAGDAGSMDAGGGAGSTDAGGDAGTGGGGTGGGSTGDAGPVDAGDAGDGG